MGLDMGGDDYITKPFRIRELVSRINAIFRRYAMVMQGGNSYNNSESEEKQSLCDYDMEKNKSQDIDSS